MTIGFKLFRLRQIPPRRIFTYMMLVSALCLLLPCRVTDTLDHSFSHLIGPLTRQSRDVTLKVTEPVRQSHAPAVSPLEHELHNLRQKVQQLEAEKKQWSNLRDEFDQAPVRIILANLIHRSSTAWSQDTFLDRGATDHIRKGQFVLGRFDTDETPNPNSPYRYCVIGRIKEICGPHNSTLQLITDANFQIPIKVEPRWNRNETWSAKGTLMGDGKGGIDIKRIRTDFPVKLGDPIMACSHPELLPVAMVAGIVKSCSRDPQNAMFWHITVAVIWPRWTQE